MSAHARQPAGTGAAPRGGGTHALDGLALSRAAGQALGVGYAYQGPSLTRDNLLALFGAYPQQVDAWVSLGDPGAEKRWLSSLGEGDQVGVFQVVDDAAAPGSATVKLLASGPVGWGQGRKFPNVALDPAGGGLVVFTAHDIAASLQAKAPQGVAVPKDSDAGKPPLLPGQAGSGLPGPDDGNLRPLIRDVIWAAALLALLVVGVALYEAHLTASQARRALPGKG